MSTITVNQWIAELENLSRGAGGDEGYLTAQELADKTGRSRAAIHKMLKTAQQAGRLLVRLKETRGIDGRKHVVVAYRVQEKRRGK